MRVFKNKNFSKFAKKENISDKKLLQAIQEAEEGILQADLGGGVIKQRLSRPNEGKSGGYRSIIFFRRTERAFFIYGFSKKDKENITDQETIHFKKLAHITLSLGDEDINLLVKKGLYEEIINHDESKNLQE